MHQPLYKDPISESYLLPWTFLHALKDYYSMPNEVNLHDVKINFNLTPVLLDQIQDYGFDENIRCVFLDMFLSCECKEYWEKLIKIMPRSLAGRIEELSKIKDEIERTNTTSQRTDKIAVLFLLSWFPEVDSEISEIKRKVIRAGTSEEDRREILNKAREIIRRVVQEYKKLKGEGRGDISFSPYYHPLIPLLVDFKVAKESSPSIDLPADFSLKDDAEDHIRLASEKYRDIFGENALFMWPSEGGVSVEACELFSKYGYKLIGTDEGILFKSIGKEDRSLIYRKYRFGDITIVFRDRELSDLIGFSYHQWNQKDAVYDFISRLRRIYENVEGNSVVSVILDGENCWEYYPNNGKEFLRTLYTELERNKNWLETISLKELLERDDIPSYFLPRIRAGSWIYGSFTKWIGCPEKNRLWNRLIEAKSSVTLIKDKRNILVAEGSDWFWWQGEIQMDELSSNFYTLFLNNIRKFVELNTK